VSERPRVHLGVLALAAAAAGIGSGAFLAFHYAPTLDDARRSVAFLQTRVHLGGFLRGVHFWAGHLAVAIHELGPILRERLAAEEGEVGGCGGVPADAVGRGADARREG